ncbi:primosomal protein N' [Planctomyces sp. SH-PL14]|uniref:replication restart helicase PriA n=1 Tax=Planctomyces sp. SH-PL14 TaxID=1632864 RepID=UPI00078D9FA8|nr:primosomal protein N' [Planctomyces sp. SH-PL14]AMV20308.1 Primosomal protein N' [Planctomyces sp. SH-PL14]
MSRQPNLFDLPPEPTPWERAAEEDRLVAAIVINRPVDTVFHYLVPQELRDLIQPGQRVRVPFGKGDQPTVGYCVDVTPTAPTSKRLKTVLEILDREPLLSRPMLELTRWIGERYLCSWGQVLESVVPAGVKKQAGTREIVCYEAAHELQNGLDALSLPAKQKRILDVLLHAGEPLAVDELSRRADCGTGPIRTLREKRLIIPVKRRTTPSAIDIGPVTIETDLNLNADQQHVLGEILKLIREGRHETVLLHGVTGSGKTEVYIQAIREVVSYGKQAIVLVPEISLTPQTIRRFRSRFPSVAVLHSHLSDAERHAQWQRIAEGEVQVIVGARSAIFAPCPHLGLIIIDEEHETTFKQQTSPRYHAREVARERARVEKIPLILGSATPTLESLLRARRKHEMLLSLPRRVEQRPLPPVVVVDTRNDPHVTRGESIGRAMRVAIGAALQDKGQVILFLNLRGYSPVLWCGRCGKGIQCPDCDITLTWHQDRKRAVCHSCDYETAAPEVCPGCGMPGLKYLGTGTQRLEKEVEAKFPDARVLRMDSDSMKKPGSHDKALDAFRHGEIDILLGTQMIAKGLDFPNVTLVGVINADTLLHQPDLRSAERTFQLIAQVAGRTGRGKRGGRVLVQSASPDEPVIQKAAKHDYLGFANLELQHRKDMLAPPFTHLARIIFRGPEESIVQAEARRVADLFKERAKGLPERVRILGPAPAPILKLKKHYRYHLQLSSETLPPLQMLWRLVQKEVTLEGGVEFIIDVDPLDMR